MASSTGSTELLARYQDLQDYVGWTATDEALVRRAAFHILNNVQALIDDFYAEIQRHPDAARVITGGDAQIARLKASLNAWLRESLQCQSDASYLRRRWSIGRRHAEIGLNPAYVGTAFARLRNGILQILASAPADSNQPLAPLVQSVNKLLDVELAIIQDAYQSEHLEREMLAEHERSEVKFRMLVETAACLVIILRPDFSIAYFSPYSEEITGYPATAVSRPKLSRPVHCRLGPRGRCPCTGRHACWPLDHRVRSAAAPARRHATVGRLERPPTRGV